jgi:surfactin synthase thioesterase subunit
MKYFNGFSLVGEDKLFKSYFWDSAYTVVGFSYGAQKALEYVYHSDTRIDRLILLSPAFFQHHKASFMRTQLRYFESNQEAYIKQFLLNVSYPSDEDLNKYTQSVKKKDLEELLTYTWDKQKIEALLKRSICIEVFVGLEDKIVESSRVLDFFRETNCLCYTLKNTGHLLSVKPKAS